MFGVVDLESLQKATVTCAQLRLWVGGIPHGATQNTLRDEFSKVGEACWGHPTGAVESWWTWNLDLRCLKAFAVDMLQHVATASCTGRMSEYEGEFHQPVRIRNVI